MSRPILLGMNNPLSDEPRHALAPYPENSAGWRLWQMLRVRRPDLLRADYLRAFDRRNLVAGREWCAAQARAAAHSFTLGDSCRGRTILVLGEDVRRALGLPRQLIHPQEVCGASWRQLPHPSGRNLWYNHPTHRLLAGLLLEELYEQAAVPRE
jgi:hypothetical protein